MQWWEDEKGGKKAVSYSSKDENALNSSIVPKRIEGRLDANKPATWSTFQSEPLSSRWGGALLREGRKR
jgi:hypothetical protein